MTDPLDPLRPHFTGLHLVYECRYGQVYSGQDTAGASVTVAVLTDAAAADQRVRAAFVDAVGQHSGVVPGRLTVYSADLHYSPLPWAAVRNPPGQAGAEQLFAGLLGGVPVPPPPAGAPPGSPAAGTPPPGSPAPGSPARGLATVGPGGTPPPGGSAQGSPQQAGPPLWSTPPPTPTPGPAAGAGRRRGSGPWLLAAAGAAVVLLLVVGAGFVAVRLLGDDRDADPEPGPPIAGPTTPAPSAPPGSPGPSQPPGGDDDDPPLRPADPVSIIGPSFGPNEDTFTMSFNDWPFAFRTPGHWNCLIGEWETVPEAMAWVCVGDPGDDQRVSVALWECETTCTEDEQAEMRDTWFEEGGGRPVQLGDEPTSYVEIHPNDDGLYQVELSHFAGRASGDGDLQWMVGVDVRSPYDTRDDVLKILNDIVSQANVG